jgi:hypothetical protein
MIFHMPHNSRNTNAINKGYLTEYVDNLNILGITINNNLKWDSNISKVVYKISRTTGLLNNLKHCLPQHILKTMYISLILPHIKYDILAW